MKPLFTFTLILSCGAPALADDKARTEEIIMGNCFVCHGVDGESSSPVFPRLAGQHAAYVERQLADYKSGRRKSSAMQPMVEDLSAADFKLLGVYFESRKPQAHKGEDAELAQVGRFIFVRGHPVLRCGRLRHLPWPHRRRHRNPATAGWPARAVHREPVEGLQQTRAHQRQRGACTALPASSTNLT